MDVRAYQKYNRQFWEKYVYRLGGSVGFFSEYNNMIIAMLYCLVHHKQFVLQSRNANFSAGEGWKEFFEPFCREVNNGMLEKYNHRIKPLYDQKSDRYAFNLYRYLILQDARFTYEFFDEMRKMPVDTIYEIPELGLKGNLRECSTEIHKMVWRYNASTGKEIERMIEGLALPKEYVGIHVRQGDKNLETEVYTPKRYMDELQKHTDCKDVFVLTDDYRVLTDLRDEYKGYRFYTLCQSNEDGYSYEKLQALTYEERRKSMLRLWASMDVMEKGQVFVGTFTANPGMNMGFRMKEEQIFGIDYEHWILW